ncbi:hypothetical protein PENSPDRAFT_206890 [Peniophora sp. CONT]|nr:hypothetical protein PENSPDRAFT_206890 [Peniophora sp. CONT]
MKRASRLNVSKSLGVLRTLASCGSTARKSYETCTMADSARISYATRMTPSKLSLKELSETDALGPRDRLVSTDIESMKIYGLIRTIPVKDVGVNDGADGKIVIRFDMPWLSFNKATKKRGRNGKTKPAHVSQNKVTVDLSPIQDEKAEPDSDMDET